MDQNADGSRGRESYFYEVLKLLGEEPSPLPYSQYTLPLILPGPHVVKSHVPGAPVTSNNLVHNPSVSPIDVTFDRDMNPSTFTPAQVLQVVGPAGAVPGPYTIIPNPLGTDPNPLNPR